VSGHRGRTGLGFFLALVSTTCQMSRFINDYFIVKIPPAAFKKITGDFLKITSDFFLNHWLFFLNHW
jgi:hypothetical protein